MDSEKLGKLISDLRKKRGFSQQYLCKNICSRKQLIRIEKGLYFPSLYTISLISKKLGDNIVKYFDYLIYPDPILIYNFFQNFEILHYNRDYKTLSLQLEIFISKYEINTIHQKIIKWYQIIVDAYSNNNFKENIQYLENLLLKNRCKGIASLEDLYKIFLEPIDYKILNTLATFYFNINQLESGITILKSTINNLLNDYEYCEASIILPMIYNLSKLLNQLGKYDECIKYVDIGIETSLSESNFLLLGDLYVQKGNALESLGKKELALKSYIYFIYFYEMQKKEDLICLAKKKISLDYCVDLI